jgi:hypothetical protein
MWQRLAGPRREKITGDWRKCHNDEFHNLYSLPNIVRVIRSKRTRWMGYVACMEQKHTVSIGNVITWKTQVYMHE